LPSISITSPTGELVLAHDEEPGDHVAHQGLRAEAQRHAHDPRAREQRPHVPAQHGERLQDRAGDHDGGGEPAAGSPQVRARASAPRRARGDHEFLERPIAR
jgi:hypothetical protein